MIYLLLAILSSSAISIAMRVSSDKITEKFSMLTVNYLVCAILGASYARFDLWLPQADRFSLMVALGAISGALYLGGFVLMQFNLGKNGIVLTSVFMKLGLLVPIAMSLLLFRETPTWMQVAGFAIAVAASVLINLKKESGAKNLGVSLFLMLLLCGGSDAMSKIYEQFGPAPLSGQFLFYTFAAATILCAGLVIHQKERPGIRELLYGTLIGVPNFFSAKFLLGALTKLPAVVVYPSFSVATLLVVTLIGVAVFRERLSKLQWAAMAAIVTALILLNV